MPERFARHIEPGTRGRIAALARVADEDWMQDWPLEVADAERLDEFVALLRAANDDDDRVALMWLVLFSLELAAPERQDSVWSGVAAILERHPALFADPIIYWSSGEETGDGTWTLEREPDHQLPLARLMRPTLSRVAPQLGLRVV